MIDPELQGKVALVTGGNHGIGAATALALAKQGVLVFFTSYGEPPPNSIIKKIEQNGGRAAALEVELSDPAVVPIVFDQAERTFGPVQILVNNAAVSFSDTYKPTDNEGLDLDRFERNLTTITAQSHDSHFAVNSRAVALMMAQFARRHISRQADWGRIINLSTDGADCFPEEISYGASKASLESYSRSAAAELGKYGITVNIVSPGATQTGWITPAFETQIAQTFPLGRIGLPEDIADVIVFLASEQARWITGQLIRVNGGQKI